MSNDSQAQAVPNFVWHPSYVPGPSHGTVSVALPNGTSGGALRPWLPSTEAGQTAQAFGSLSVSGEQDHTLQSFSPSADPSAGAAAAPPQAYIAYPELTCLHCLGANPPGKLGYVVSYIPATISASGEPVPIGSAASCGTAGEGIEGAWQKVSRREARSSSRGRGGRPESVLEEDEGEGDRRGRDNRRQQVRGKAQGERSRSAFRAGDIIGDKQYVPDGTEDDMVADVVE